MLRISCQDNLNDDCDQDGELVIYKIGDFGHVISVKHPQIENEGDCRYLSKEALNLPISDCRHLFKVDMFSLGATLYEAGGGGPLPKNGVEWHNLRDGKVPDLKGISRDFNDLIKVNYSISTKCLARLKLFNIAVTFTSRSIETTVVDVNFSTSRSLSVRNQIKGSTVARTYNGTKEK